MNKDILKAFDLNGGQGLTEDKFYHLLSRQGLSKYDPRLSGIDRQLTKGSGANGNTTIRAMRIQLTMLRVFAFTT